MKQGTLFTKIAILVLFAGLVLYLGVYAWNSFRDPFSTTYAYTATQRDSVDASGILVRAETVLEAPEGIIDLYLDEGESVAVNGAIAAVYQDNTALANREQIDALTVEALQLEAALGSGDVANTDLDKSIVDSLGALRFAAAQRDFTALEDQVLALKGAVLKREYTYGAAAQTTDLQSRLNEINSQISALERQTGSAAGTVRARVSGIFSAVADGYESLITPDSVLTLTPSGLTALLEQQVLPPENALGKIITDSHWYFAAAVDQQAAERLTVGAQYPVRFSMDFEGEISMQVVSISPAGDGKQVVVLTSSRYLSQTTLLRKQTVRIDYNTVTGIRIPLSALRIDGEGTTGVYVVVGARAEFKPVEIVYQGDDYYLVRSVDSDKTALRSGDEVIVAAQGLYDGKLVR